MLRYKTGIHATNTTIARRTAYGTPAHTIPAGDRQNKHPSSVTLPRDKALALTR
jgi:hypothetical protein